MDSHKGFESFRGVCAQVADDWYCANGSSMLGCYQCLELCRLFVNSNRQVIHKQRSLSDLSPLFTVIETGSLQ